MDLNVRPALQLIRLVSPDESDVTETPLEKSGVIREEFISVV
jgi:hypothetical protein